MRTLAIDIETYSENDIKSGVYRYVECPKFEILLFAWAFDDEPVTVQDLQKDPVLPERVRNALTDPTVLKTAFNAAFERTCMQKYFGIKLPVEEWECTQVKGAMISLPFSLDHVTQLLKVEKKADGKALIKYFSVPCRPTNKNGQRTRNLPEHDPEKWQLFIKYCGQDVVAERATRNKLSFFPFPEKEKKLWCLDQKINEKGIALDRKLIHNAIGLNKIYIDRLTEEAIEITSLENPNSVAQLKDWLEKEMDESIPTLNKIIIPSILASTDDEKVKRVLNIRKEMGKTSVKKYATMLKMICADGRLKGLVQFYGANKTGRWAGRGVQVHNLPLNKLPDLDLARQLVKEGDLDLLEMLFGNVPDTLSQLIRTAFIASPGNRLLTADFKQIEARIIAWLAGEAWRMEVFNTHELIYEASAAQMFKIPIEWVTKQSVYRQKGKIAELALGYQGASNALIGMGALDMGLKVDELEEIVTAWRTANKQICRYWYKVEEAAVKCVEQKIPVKLDHGISFEVKRGILFLTLPSGRKLSYLKPQLRPGPYGKPSLVYEGMDQQTKKWYRQTTYGGKLVENIVQATARDILAEAMLALDDAGYAIVMHVHDEIVNDMPVGSGSLEEINSIMGRPIPWAKGLPLKADSFESIYYKKD
jgi:DNA polymerase